MKEPKYKIGDYVFYNGKKRIVERIRVSIGLVTPKKYLPSTNLISYSCGDLTYRYKLRGVRAMIYEEDLNTLDKNE